MFSRAYQLLSDFLSSMWRSRKMVERCSLRCGHIAFCDGQKLYVWGGYYWNNTVIHSPNNEVWIYSEQFNTWMCQKCSGDCPNGTSGAACALILPYAYVIGGHRQHVGHDFTVYRLHLTEFVWEKVKIEGTNISPRDKFSAWAYQDKIYCFGGYGPDPKDYGVCHNGDYVEDESDQGSWSRLGWNNQVLILDTAAHCWRNPSFKGTSPAPLPRAAHATVLLGDKVYLFGGRHKQHRMNDLHCLDLRTLTWSGPLETSGTQPVGRSWHTLSAINEDRLFLYGGFTEGAAVLADVWILTVSTSCWVQMAENTGNPRLWHTAVTTDSQSVLIFGGCSGNILYDHLQPANFSDKVMKFQLQPLRLDRLCLKYISDHFNKQDWEMLPLQLKNWLTKNRDAQDRWLAVPANLRRRIGPHVLNGFRDEFGGGGDSYS